ncbi:MAG: hypothetical protein RQ748_08540 [Elusimicrobiales bacterium]|nr:hypothetical protein [Elusimicrobiales bacterium]
MRKAERRMEAEFGEGPAGVPFDLAGQLTDRLPYGKVSLVCGARYSGEEMFLRSVLAGVIAGRKSRAAVLLPNAYLPHFVFRIQCAMAGVDTNRVTQGMAPKESWAALKKAGELIASSKVVFARATRLSAEVIDSRVRLLAAEASAEGHKLELVIVHSLDALRPDHPDEGPGDAVGWMAQCAEETGAAFLCSWRAPDKKLVDDDFSLADLRRHGFNEERLGPVFWLFSGADGDYGTTHCLKAWDPSAPFDMSQELIRDPDRCCFKPNLMTLPPIVRVSRSKAK